MNEADTCRVHVTPKLQAAGWDCEPRRISEQVTFTDGRIVVMGQRAHRRPGKRADYILRFRPDMAIAVIEAKPDTSPAGEGMQQAKEYAEILGLRFAYSTNGPEISAGSPPLRDQRRIVAELDALQAQVDSLKRLQAETAAELDALLPSILDKAFKGEL